MKGKVIFEDDNVYVTPTRFVSGNTTYSIRNITSVRMVEKSGGKSFIFMLLLILIGIIIFTMSKLIGFIIIVASLIFTLKDKKEYTVKICSSAGEATKSVGI